MKTQIGILLAAFGTCEIQARMAYDNFERLARLRFPKTEIHWAFTSRMIREKLAQRGEKFYSPATALEKFQKDGFSHLAVQSLHVVTGVEYDNLRADVAEFIRTKAFEKITIGMPLFASHNDIEHLAQTLIKEVPAERRSGDAVIFMGHGSAKHPADIAYVAAHAVFQKIDELAYVATVEGYPTIEEIVGECRKKKVTKAFLVPLMMVAGDHARNDMAGDDSKSWKNILARNGIASVPVLKGLGEIDTVANIWLDHLDNALKELALEAQQ